MIICLARAQIFLCDVMTKRGVALHFLRDRLKGPSKANTIIFWNFPAELN